MSKVTIMDTVAIRFSSADRALVERAAERDGLPFTTWTREVALAAARMGLRVRATRRVVRERELVAGRKARRALAA